MKINLTKNQYRSLIDLVHLGDMMVNGIRTTDKIEEYEELREYIYSFAKQMGCGDCIKYDAKYGMHFETRDFETGKIEEYISEYDNEVFWTELPSRLADRDIIRLQKLTGEITDREERLRKVWAKEEEYQVEFENNGLENVEVKFQDK
ncbi:MAG: hypothetical protein JJU16_01385 [Alkalibacterium sp.]|nr:hypothetical protein [Alkalibacterium sp.]